MFRDFGCAAAVLALSVGVLASCSGSAPHTTGSASAVAAMSPTVAPAGPGAAASALPPETTDPRRTVVVLQAALEQELPDSFVALRNSPSGYVVQMRPEGVTAAMSIVLARFPVEVSSGLAFSQRQAYRQSLATALTAQGFRLNSLGVHPGLTRPDVDVVAFPGTDHEVVKRDLTQAIGTVAHDFAATLVDPAQQDMVILAAKTPQIHVSSTPSKSAAPSSPGGTSSGS